MAVCTFVDPRTGWNMLRAGYGKPALAVISKHVTQAVAEAFDVRDGPVSVVGAAAAEEALHEGQEGHDDASDDDDGGLFDSCCVPDVSPSALRQKLVIDEIMKYRKLLKSMKPAEREQLDPLAFWFK